MGIIGGLEVVVVVVLALAPFWMILWFAQKRRPLPESEGYPEIEYQDDDYHYEPVGSVVDGTCEPYR